jgi:phage replication-related protein YjqB (UPF0714/DUF867 family)
MFERLLAHPGVEEVCELRSSFGFMAFHGGSLEQHTDVIARLAAEKSGSSYYGVHQPPDLKWHIDSHKIRPSASAALSSFIHHVDVVVTIHGYGRQGLFTTLLLGGKNRGLASHVAQHLRSWLPTYDIEHDLQKIPIDLAGQHDLNPVNLPRGGGVQIELPPRVRGSGPHWRKWEGPALTPHTQALVEGLTAAAVSWSALMPVVR